MQDNPVMYNYKDCKITKRASYSFRILSLISLDCVECLWFTLILLYLCTVYLYICLSCIYKLYILICINDILYIYIFVFVEAWNISVRGLGLTPPPGCVDRKEPTTSPLQELADIRQRHRQRSASKKLPMGCMVCFLAVDVHTYLFTVYILFTYIHVNKNIHIYLFIYLEFIYIYTLYLCYICILYFC